MTLVDKRYMHVTQQRKDSDAHTHQKYDKVTKEFLDRNDILASLLNMTRLFKPYILRPEDITDMPTEEILYDNGVKHSVFRDKLKCCAVRMEDTIIQVLIGIENQMKTDDRMVIRCFAYDAGDYLRLLRNSECIYAVMTIVLNWSEKRWKDTRTLLDHTGLPEEFRDRFFDGPLNVIDMRYFTEKEIETSDVSDLKDVLCIARLSRNKEEYTEYVKAHPDWEVTNGTADLCNTLFDTEIKGPGKGGKINMCTAVRELKKEAIQQGIQKGIQQGIQKGIQQGRKEQTEKNIQYCFRSFKMLVPGLSDENIIQKLADDFHMTVDEVKGLVRDRV